MRLRTVFLLGLSSLLHGQSAVREWEVFEIRMSARGAYANPYVEGPLAQVAFTGVAGPSRGMRYTVAAFWDGGQEWKARFAPPAAGEWSYASSSSDAGLAGVRGALRVDAWSEAAKRENPVRRGFVRVARGGPRPGRHFEYADGTPFLWVGDTWWAWGSKKKVLLSSFQKMVDDRAAKGFTVGQIYFVGNDALGKTFDHPDLDQVRKVEQMVACANSKGITVWIHPWWSRKGLNERVGEEKLRRFWRYVLHRMGAHNVIWTLAGEYNMNAYGGFGLDFWRGVGAWIKREDPYERLVGAHPTPPGWQGGAEAPQWSTGEVIHDQPWLDYNQSQVGHGRWRNEMIPRVISADYARRPVKPTLVTEPWYEFIEGSPPAMDVRFAAWSAILSGAAGHTYGGGHVWWAHVPESPSGVGAWPLDPSFETNTLDYPGARSMSFLAKFLGGLEWWKLEPHPDLISDYPAPFCSAVPGQEYVAYLRYGGALKADLRPSAADGTFEFTWIDLAAGKPVRSGTVNGGAAREFHAPEDYPGTREFKDWLLHIRKRRE
ncbi:MAG: DUF4038 domain-containing protein [Acidobacteria bacterium]|nr:DUF4038 domain-containing protein [Acidobacteriota bacterium]